MPRTCPRRRTGRRLLAYVVVALASVALLAPVPAPARDAVKKPAARKEQRQKPKQAGNSFLWKVTSAEGGGTAYLLGSIHVARPDFYPLAPEIERAFEESKVLVVELDALGPAAGAAQTLLLTKGTYQDGSTLEDNLSADTLKALRAYANKGGLPLEALQQFRPWVVALTVSMTEMQKLGFQPTLGVDHHFLTKAHDSKKRIVELETAESQIDLLSGMDKEVADKFLLQTLVGLDELDDLLTKGVAAWKAGDLKTLKEELMDKPLREAPETKPVMVKLFDERNAKMADRVEEFLKGDEQHFVVVGAGHMLGDKGIVKLLEDKGFTVEQMRVTAGAAKKPAKR
jgi:uncharacterized protein YbaP (TraB family)